MKKGFVPGLTFAVAFAFAATPALAVDIQDVRTDVQTDVEQVGEGPGSFAIAFEEAPSHIFLTREEYDRALTRQPLARRSPNMTYHGGKILTTTSTKAIFWGTSWGSYSGDKISGIDTWYGGFGLSNYANTTTEYTGSNGTVSTVSHYLGHVVDSTAAKGGGSTSAILSEACKFFTGPNDGSAYYAVYTDLPRGNAGYCAWHSAGTCGGVPVQFAFFWKLDGDAGCDPGDTSGLHSQGLAALANVSGHELAEAMTDPASPGAWYDSTGYENGDKCAWTWGAPLIKFSDGTWWKVQGEWSNAAYNAGTGYPNSSGQKGCLGGQ